jgi:ABC-type protease/lipase transport system fused ATPase/permease subunit
MVVPAITTSKELIDALRLVEQWGPFCEAMYLMMAADRRVLNVEREVLRGALAVLSGETVRTRHMEAMLDAAMRKVATEGTERRLAKVIEALTIRRGRSPRWWSRRRSRRPISASSPKRARCSSAWSKVSGSRRSAPQRSWPT